MKIGVVGPIWLNIPPEKYGGTEEVVYNLVQGLHKKGEDVTLFGPGTSKVSAKVISVTDKPLRARNIDWSNITYTLLNITRAFDIENEFDIIHVHLNKSSDYFALPLAVYSKTPVIFTIHFKLPTETFKHDRLDLLYKYRNLPFTSISKDQVKDSPLNVVETVYNSVNADEYEFNPKPEDYFVWLGRVFPEKGTKEAILAAKKAGVVLKLMGVVDEGNAESVEYYEKEVKPLIDGKQIIWLGEVNLAEKSRVLGGAKAFLNPILWEEPFGLVMAESQLCGTPVISFDRGAAAEIILDGKTGFLVKTIDEMVEKMKEVDKLDRAACRHHIEENFNPSKMVDGYLAAYEKTIANWTSYKEATIKSFS